MRKKSAKHSSNSPNIWERDPSYASDLSFNDLMKSQPFAILDRLLSSDDKSLSLNASYHVPPRGLKTLYASAKPGSTMTLQLKRLEGSGGHLHTGGPTGSVNPNTIVFGSNYPQNIPLMFTAPDCAGIIEMFASVSTGETNNINYLVRIFGLASLTSSNSIVLTGSKASHPDNHYGTPDFIDKINQLADSFYAAFKKPLYVNDMSLEWGGLFDHESSWKPPHAAHQEGRNADMNSRSMSKKEKEFFQAKARELGLNAVEHGSPLHWHLSI